jgi:steroid delta-isomerase-like uncharacterized protein
VTGARETETAVRAYLAALDAGDPGAVAACVTEDFVNEHTSRLAESVCGREAYRERLAAFLAEFRALRYEIEELIVDGERCAVAYRMSARWAGTDPGSPRDRPFTLRGMFRFRVEAGRIAHRVDYFDSAEFERQVR